MNLSTPQDRNLQALSKKILRILRKTDSEFDLFLLRNREMAALKARFIKKKTEPNVLAFPEPARFPHPEMKKNYLGEIYLNKDIVKKTPDRTAPLLVHGILHLLGFDHKKESDFKKMQILEQKVLEKLAG
jgi:probable rRNA maturation factor